MIPILLMIVATIVVRICADYFVKYIVKIGHQQKISEYILSVTAIAIGTSLPEFVVSVSSSVQGLSDFAMGNVLGSNVVNIFLIGGIIGFFYKDFFHFRLDLKKIWKLMLLTGVLILASKTLLIGESVVLGRWDGVMLIVIYGWIIWGQLSQRQRKQLEEKNNDENSLSQNILFAISALCGLIGASYIVIYGANQLVEDFSLSTHFVGIVLLALSTSLPELFTSLNAMKHGKPEIVRGNILGSNMCNIGLVAGVSILIYPIKNFQIFEQDLAWGLIGILILLLIQSTTNKNITKRGGGVLLILYVLIILFAYLW